jgi:hypothetical protein
MHIPPSLEPSQSKKNVRARAENIYIPPSLQPSFSEAKLAYPHWKRIFRHLCNHQKAKQQSGSALKRIFHHLCNHHSQKNIADHSSISTTITKLKTLPARAENAYSVISASIRMPTTLRIRSEAANDGISATIAKLKQTLLERAENAYSAISATIILRTILRIQTGNRTLYVTNNQSRPTQIADPHWKRIFSSAPHGKIMETLFSKQNLRTPVHTWVGLRAKGTAKSEPWAQAQFGKQHFWQ